jgi:uncharacterized protein
MIIDAHVHLGKSYAWASYESYTFQTPLGPRDTFDAEVFSEIMRNLKIDAAVIMTSKQASSSGDNTRENKEIASIARRNPDKFFGMAIVDPLKENAPEELTRYVQELGIKALKLHPYAQCYSPILPCVQTLVERAVRLRVPVMVHSGTAPHTTPLQIATLADLFPDATIILAHAGLSETYAADARLAAKRHENVFLETSCLPAGYVGMAIREIGAERVMFGSDSPWNVTETELDKIKVLKLPEEDEIRVLGGTAAKVFEIKE